MNAAIENKIKEFETKRNITFVLVLVILSATSVVLNNLHKTQLAQEYADSAKRYLAIGDSRELTYLLNQAQISSFDKIEYKSARKERNLVFPIREYNPYKTDTSAKYFYTDTVEFAMDYGVGNDNSDLLIFEFNRFSLVKYAALAWFLILLISFPQVSFMKKQYILKFEELLVLEKKSAKSEIAQQVKHNLRTPLSVLMRLSDLSDSKNILDDRQMLKSTIYQINEIINKLDGDGKTEISSGSHDAGIYNTLYTSKKDIQLITPEYVSVVFKIDDSISSMNSLHIPAELRSILSNIANNSFEAINGKGHLVIKAQDKNRYLEIVITDSGKGIPEDIIDKVFDKNFSYDKPKGSGIGLSHAKNYVENWGGEITIRSALGMGTTIIIKLPIDSRKAWYAPEIKISASTDIIILDDQELVHDLWKLKFKDLSLNNKVYFAFNATEFKDHLNQIDVEQRNRALYLIDYDLKATMTGLDVLKTIPASASRCLVTGHFDNLSIQNQCEHEQIKLISKSILSEIPLLVI